MKRITLLLFLAIFISKFSAGQGKKPLDYTTGDNWPSVNIEIISDDGRAILYSYDSGQFHSLVIATTDNSYKREMVGATNGVFIDDSKWFAYFLPPDTLTVLMPGSDSVLSIAGVVNFKAPKKNYKAWLAYQLNNSSKQLVIRNLSSREMKIIDSVIDYQFSDDGKVLEVTKECGQYASHIFTVDLLYVNSWKESQIWSGDARPQHFIFNGESSGAALVIGGNDNSILYYEIWDTTVRMLINNRTVSSNLGLTSVVVSDLVAFAGNAKMLFFKIKEKSLDVNGKNAQSRAARVDIWTYNDVKLRPKQTGGVDDQSNRSYLVAVDCVTGKIIRIEGKDDELLGSLEKSDGRFVLVSHSNGGDWNERGWNEAARPSIYLVSLKDGNRVLIKDHIFPMDLQQNTQLSPGNKYVVYFDQEKGDYFSYLIANGEVRNITKSMPSRPYDKSNDMPTSARANGLGAWVGNDRFLLIYDNNDVWRVDLAGERSAVDLTKGYGRSNSVILRLLFGQEGTNMPFLGENDSVILVGFNKVNKYNGLFRLWLDRRGPPKMLNMGPYLYYYPLSSYAVFTLPPLKAKNAEKYVFIRRSCTEAPNIFFTDDLRKFTQLSDIRPQLKYNWFTSQLVHWNIQNGEKAEGILYKPENFDPSRKYPIIFYFYEKDADGLYNFLAPDLTSGEINIPYFASNGYLIFDPNIYYTRGHPGPSALQSVLSAVKYLSKMSFVDTTRMGLQGISFGGYEVNYIVTHSNMFAAAAEVAGPVDFISGYGGMNDQGWSFQFQYELGQNRLGATLWQRPDLYISNSPIFPADKVVTPLLIMHNKEDDAVPFQQGVELFTAFRRLKKQVWMLQYDGEGHGVREHINQLDYSIRLTQFFDHFLMGKPAPKWMQTSK